MDRGAKYWAMVIDVFKVSGAFDLFIEPPPMVLRRNITTAIGEGLAKLLSVPVLDFTHLEVDASDSVPATVEVAVYSAVYAVVVKDATVPQVTRDMTDIDYVDRKARRALSRLLASMGYTVVDISVTSLPRMFKDPRAESDFETKSEALGRSSFTFVVLLIFAMRLVRCEAL